MDDGTGRNQFRRRTGAANRFHYLRVNRVARGGGGGVDGFGQCQRDRQADGQRHATAAGTPCGRGLSAGGRGEDDFRFRLILAAVSESGDVARFFAVLEQDLQLALARQQNVAVADVNSLVVEGGGGLTEGGDGGQLAGADGQALEFERLRIDLKIALICGGMPRGGGFDLEVAGFQGYVVSILEHGLAVYGALAVVLEFDAPLAEYACEMAPEI